MKKIIALLLALIMTFSVATVAFATEGEATAPETETTVPAEGETEGEGSITDDLDEMLGEYSWILDLPFGTVGPALQIAKMALKFLKVYLKICAVFNLDPQETAESIFEWIGGLAEKYAPSEGEGTEESTTAPAAA